MAAHSFVSAVKGWFVPSGYSPRRILSGAFRGIRMNLDLSSQTQYVLGLHERETHAWLRRLSQGVATAIDVGADQGEYRVFVVRN